ncbi:MAG: peptidylprolyl isomerase [Chlamydiota bacterium]
MISKIKDNFTPLPTMRSIFLFLSVASATVLAAQMQNPDFSKNQKIAVQNAILARVNGNTISMIDVKKKMDFLFHQNYPQYSDSNQARFQFYESSWRHLFMEMVDNELILSDAADKEIKLTDGEIREEMEGRFGPNVMQTLDKIGATYEETWKMVKNEMIVRRMTWWFIHSKAIQSVTPQEVRQAYRLFIQENPPYSEWKYRVVSIRTENPNETLSEQVYQLLTESCQSPEFLTEALKELESPGIAIQVSNEYTGTEKDLADLHKSALASLTPGAYGKPTSQTSRVDKKTVYRIFYLTEKTDHPAPSFEEISQKLQGDLTQKAIVHHSQGYLGKLRKHYGFDAAHLKETMPDQLHPFSLQ